MGGIGSGARRSTHIGNLEEVPALDIRALRRLGVVAPGECIIDTLHWSIGGLSASRVRLRVDLTDVECGGVMTIIGDMTDGTIKQPVAIEVLPSPLGGHRCYFICPFTARRCEVLYYAKGRFASREAQHLSYAVQGMSQISRAYRKITKLRSRLCGSGGLPRPRGRNRIDMVDRLRQAEFKAHALYLQQLRALSVWSGTHRTPGK